MRKPIEQELVGLLTPRERMWQGIRKLRVFTPLALANGVKPPVHIETVRTYLQGLEKAGHVRVQTPRARVGGGRFTEATYALDKDSFEAPRIDTTGAKVVQGTGTLAMWRAMKALKDFDYSDIQRAATIGEFTVTQATARSYVIALARAGYFRTVRESKPGTPARYRLTRDTGAHAPSITRLKVVFDRNTGAVSHLQTLQEVCDGIE